MTDLLSDDAIAEIAERYEELSSDRGSHLGTLKHDLSHLFLPIDTDLRGWIESGFDKAYGKDIAEAYSCEDIKKMTVNAKKIVYGEGGVRDIVREKDLDNTLSFKQLRILIPEKKTPLQLEVLCAFCICNLDRAQELLEKECTFCDWFRNVEKVMYKLQRSVSGHRDSIAYLPDILLRKSNNSSRPTLHPPIRKASDLQVERIGTRDSD